MFLNCFVSSCPDPFFRAFAGHLSCPCKNFDGHTGVLGSAFVKSLQKCFAELLLIHRCFAYLVNNLSMVKEEFREADDAKKM